MSGELTSRYPCSEFTVNAETGAVTVDQWYLRQLISPELAASDNEMIGTLITIKVANGRAVYRVVGMDSGGTYFVCDKVGGE